MGSNPRHDERVQLEHVRQDLAREFPMLPAAVIDTHVGQVEQMFAGAPVRTFIPVLVGRSARARLKSIV